MLASGRIMQTRKTDVSSKLRPELWSDVTSYRVKLQILYSFHFVEWNFEYMFRTAARLV